MKLSFLVLILSLSVNGFSQITDPSPYCVFNSWGAAPINNVQLGPLDHNPAYDWATTMYNFYNEEVVPDITIGEAIPMTITFGDAGDMEPQLFGVYIDFNHDNVFTEDEDLMNNWSTGGGYLPCWAGTDEVRDGTITVPLTGTPGLTRMRIVRSHLIPFMDIDPPADSQAAPCNPGTDWDDTDYSYGAAVDYIVNLVEAGPTELTALFTPENTTICNDEILTFTDASLSEDGVTEWNWTFEGGTPAAAATEGPHDITFTTPGVYTVSLEVTDPSGTADTSFTITVEDCTDPLTALFTPENTTICIDDMLTFTDASLSEEGITDWNWTFDGGTPAAATTEGPHDIVFLTAGAFDITLEVTDLTGTHDTSFTITVLEDCDEIEASFTAPVTEVCEGECITFDNTSTGVGIIEYVWTFSDPEIGGPIMGEDPGEICFNNAGDHTVILTITNGVIVDDTTITITVNALPDIDITADPGTEVCVGEEVTLAGTGGIDYLWSGGVLNGVPFVPLASETYTVVGEDGNGCLGEAEITLTLIDCEPVVVAFEFDSEICAGDCIRFKDLSTGEIVAWNWNFGGGEPAASTDQNPTVCFDNPGEFDVTLSVEDASGDVLEITENILVNEAPSLEALRDTIIELGGEAVLFGDGSDANGTYVWEPSDALTCLDCQLTHASPWKDMTYYVTHTSVNGCVSEDSAKVMVNFQEAIGVASAFSPNGDGNNDVLYVQGFGIKQMSFVVYNRYGEQVFQTNDQRIGWDGSFLDQKQVPGVFFWVLQYDLIDGNSGEMSGSTTLFR